MSSINSEAALWLDMSVMRMKHKRLRKILIFVFMLCIVFANATCFASAIDPVSAATMANALAQAISAYGATQGVSMTFDVADSSGIGEGMHDLWDQFVKDINDPNTPTYDTLAITMWSNLYSKIGNNLGVNISASEMPFIDSFWNWLLSGPAEMTKVDDQYYEWTVVNDTVNPILVNQSTITSFGNYVAYSPDTLFTFSNNLNYKSVNYVPSVQNCVILPCYLTTDHNASQISFFIYSSENSFSCNIVRIDNNNNSTVTSGRSTTYSNLAGSIFNNNPFDTTGYTGGINNYAYYEIIAQLRENLPTISTISNDISVRPYIGDATPQNVYIPDNNDVNYAPTDHAIPLDIPWDNTLFGDGDGALTDEQSEAASAAADDAITDSINKTLTIANTENPDIPAPNEVYIPFLPLTLPSFNFSLSGIWHYVVEWVNSLGAWFTTMLQIWSVLPYAMVVPVYATLVVVIVLGVYRRFLS